MAPATSNFSTVQTYNGMDDLIVGKGNSLSIAHTRSLSIQSKLGIQKLRNALHVPGICQKLIFIRCLASDLNAYVTIDEHGFFVKKKQSGKMIVCGRNIAGIYRLSKISYSNATTLAGIRTDTTGWHHRLGHPSDQVLSKVIFKVPHNGSDSIKFFLRVLQIIKAANCHSPLAIIQQKHRSILFILTSGDHHQ